VFVATSVRHNSRDVKNPPHKLRMRITLYWVNWEPLISLRSSDPSSGGQCPLIQGSMGGIFPVEEEQVNRP
jgi:hypothetical protein